MKEKSILEIHDHLNAVVKLDTNGNIISYNQAFAKQYGYNEQDFKKPFLEFSLKMNSLKINNILKKPY